MAYNISSNPGETKWNIDNARMQVMEYYLEQLETAFLDWNIPLINQYTRAVARSILGTGKAEGETKIKQGLKELEAMKRKIDSNEDDDKAEELIVKFYNKAEEILEEIHRQNTIAGVYFRRGKDPTRAAYDF